MSFYFYIYTPTTNIWEEVSVRIIEELVFRRGGGGVLKSMRFKDGREESRKKGRDSDSRPRLLL